MMKEKEQAAVCVDDKGCTEQTRTTDKEIFDDSCFKTPLLLPPRKGGGRRRGSATRNGQQNAHETSRRRSSSPARSPEKESFPNGSPPSSSRPNSKLTSCSCSNSYLTSVLPKSDRIASMKETIIDEFSLLLFKNKEEFQAFQAEVDAAKAKEEAEQRKRQYEENVRLGLVKKKGRKSKAQIEKEKKEERRRLRREKKEQRRREKREHREKEGVCVEAKERKSRKERRERKREKKERKENERKEREKLAAEKKEAAAEKKERKPRKPRDPNAPRKPRQPRQPKASTSSTPEVTSNISGSTAAASAIVPWMNDATLSVCAASPLPTAAHPLKRPLDAIRDPLTSGDKRVKLDAPYEDFKNGLIGIAVKSDSSAIVGASPPSAPRISATSGGVHLSDASTVTSTAGGNSATPWSTQLLSRPRSDTSEQRASTTSSSVVETTHPVDPGHNAPSTSLAPSVPSTSVSANANSVALPLQGTTSLFVNTSMGPPSIASAVTVGGGVPTGSGILSARDFTTSAADPRATPQSALLDPLRQAFLSNPSFAASLNAAAGFGNAFLAGAPPNAAAAAFPFLAAQILQQQQAQQPMSLSQSGSVGSASSMAGMTQPSASNTAAAVAAGVQFPPGAALGPQLAGAALLGRTLPAAAGLSQTALPIKAKQGRWCAMHVKIAYEISSRKERRTTPQPVSTASSSSSQSAGAASTLRNTAPVAPPLCPPSTSNAHLASLTGGFSNTFSAMAAAGALQPPFGSLPFQQLTDPNKLVRQTSYFVNCPFPPRDLFTRCYPWEHQTTSRNSTSGSPTSQNGAAANSRTTPKPPQGRPASAMQRGGTTATGPSGMHLQLGAAGMGAAASLGAASMSLGAANALQGAIPNVVGASLPLTAALPASGSLTNGTSDAAAQAAMFAALAQGAQQGTGLPSAALSSNPFLLSAAAAQQQHSLSAAAMAAGNPSQSQSVFSSQRLFDPTMTAAVLQQMQSMEAMRQSAAAAQMNAAAAVAAANANQHASATGAANATTLDLMRMQMEQQMMERYAAAMNAATASSSGTPAAPSAGQPSSNHSLDLMRQQLFAAQLRQQQQQQQQAAAVAAATQQQNSAAAQQPSLEALIEMQRQQQQQQQLLNASRAALPGGYALPAVATAGIPSSPSLPQGLSASGFFNASHLMSMGGAAAAAANLQQSLYGKNPYSNTLEQLARQKRDGDMMQQGR